MPRLPPEYATWMGRIKAWPTAPPAHCPAAGDAAKWHILTGRAQGADEVRSQYAVDDVFYVEDLSKQLARPARDAAARCQWVLRQG